MSLVSYLVRFKVKDNGDEMIIKKVKLNLFK